MTMFSRLRDPRPLMRCLRTAALSLLLAAPALAADPDRDKPNLLANADFSQVKDGKIVGWQAVGENAVSVEPAGDLEGKPNCLKAVVKKAEGKNLGQIIQKVAVRPNTRYRLSGRIKADVARIAVLQIKRLEGRKEIERLATDWSQAAWTSVTKTFDSGTTSEVHVICRFRQEAEHVGKAAFFAELKLAEAGELAYTGPERGPTAVPTFNCVGLYWQVPGGSPKRECSVRYRPAGEAKWRQAMGLWFDPHEHKDLPERSLEYRGSIVYLDSGRQYEVELSLAGGPTRTLSFSTWDERFKVARTVELPARRSETFVIRQGGSEKDGYVVYAPPPGGASEWDAQGKHEVNLRVEAPYVIVRGLTLKGAVAHGIELGDVHHVVIENCDISGWGRTRPGVGFGQNLDSAIYSRSRELEHVVVQRCRLHHPRSNSNSWLQKRSDADYHPQGPQGITFLRSKGRHVIRHNRIESDLEHMFNDAMGEVHNFSFDGFPNRDSDVHGNYVSHCWDDGLEIEGANMNVRVWDNYIDLTFDGLGAASTSLGPAYYFRNVYAISRHSGGNDTRSHRGHCLIKLGADPERAQFAGGRKYFLHNTALQPPSALDATKPGGAGAGIVLTSSTKRELNIVSRNNILQTRRAGDSAVRDPQRSPTNDFDYDLYTGAILAVDGAEAHGIQAPPQYERAPDGQLWLTPGTPGHDAATPLPNFNDDFVGKGPDIGAVETGTTAVKPPLWPEFPAQK